MQDFVAIDFETANQNPLKCLCDRVCSRAEWCNTERLFRTHLPQAGIQLLGTVGGELKLDLQTLLPNPPFVNYGHNLALRWVGFRLHRITRSRHASVIRVFAYREGNQSQLTSGYVRWRLSRFLLPGLPNHRLSTLAALFGINLKHHQAQSDAVACAEIAIRLFASCRGSGGRWPPLSIP